jgi:basic membrane lipoprotein Med (substrate-binding protein (PBP1-ABC) superfamily)
MGLMMVFGVVGAAEKRQANVTNANAPNPLPAIGLVTDENGVDGDVINWLCHQGLLRAENELGLTGAVYTPTDSGDYAARLQQCADEGNLVCISTAWSLRDATLNAANNNPGRDFAIIDQSYDTYPDNLHGAMFAHDQAGYLAGVLAGSMTDSEVVGDIGGMKIPAVDEFVHGYRNGAQCANSAVRVLIDYAGNFGNPALGAEMAQTMIAQDADVILAPAGYTGVGSILSATQSGVWGIGVDLDFYYTVFNSGAVSGTDKLLSSAVKRFDNAVFETISETIHGGFISGTVVYGLDVEGVGLAPFHDTDPAVPQSVRDALTAATAGIIDGSIDLAEDCRVYLYLPSILKPGER